MAMLNIEYSSMDIYLAKYFQCDAKVIFGFNEMQIFFQNMDLIAYSRVQGNLCNSTVGQPRLNNTDSMHTVCCM